MRHRSCISYPNLCALHHLDELSVVTCTIAVYDKSEVVCVFLPVELLLGRIRVASG